MMRNCVIGILGTVVNKFRESENLSADQKSKRDDCLDNILEHFLDANAYVRSKVLQVCQNLCSDGAVPLAAQNDLLKATIFRLDDKSAIVRKYAFQLLRTMLQCNPLAGEVIEYSSPFTYRSKLTDFLLAISSTTKNWCSSIKRQRAVSRP